MRPSQYRHLYTTACLSLLSELGITTLDELLCKNGKGQATLISSAELKRRYGSQAQAKHLRALNKLTVLAHEGTAGYAPYRTSYGGCAPLASCLRVIHQDVLEAEFRKHSQLQSRDVRGTRAPNSQLHGTQLIQRRVCKSYTGTCTQIFSRRPAAGHHDTEEEVQVQPQAQT